jgi:hypothetical protein
MGLKPWERDRLTPAEIMELWEGFLWRERRLAWSLAATAQLIGACWVGKNAPDAESTWGWIGFGGEKDDGSEP